MHIFGYDGNSMALYIKLPMLQGTIDQGALNGTTLTIIAYRLRDLDTTECESSVSRKTKMTTVVLPRHNRVC